jgi:predicted GNAT superfamily acetyltransferase
MPTTKKIKRIFVPPNVDDLKSADPAQAAAIQAQIRSEFVKLFGKEYAATAIEPAKGGMNYILEHWSAK